VETSLEVAGEPQFVDVYFVPSAQSAVIPTDLGILGRMVQTPCLIEPFRNQPTSVEVRSCLLKLFQVHGDYHRRAKRSSESLPEANLPQLWILASSASEALLYKFGAISEETGVYFLPKALRTVIISINQLPCNESTLWLRLLGKGRTQEQAIAEVIAFDVGDPRRSSILNVIGELEN
jgi:hypothetical protein